MDLYTNEEKYIQAGYEIRNAKITSTALTMADHGCITYWVHIHTGSWDCGIGGYCLGHGYVGIKPEDIDGYGPGLASIAHIMNTVGVSTESELKGKYIRVARKKGESSIYIIGNIIEDKWFNLKEFFERENVKNGD